MREFGGAVRRPNAGVRSVAVRFRMALIRRRRGTESGAVWFTDYAAREAPLRSEKRAVREGSRWCENHTQREGMCG